MLSYLKCLTGVHQYKIYKELPIREKYSKGNIITGYIVIQICESCGKIHEKRITASIKSPYNI